MTSFRPKVYAIPSWTQTPRAGGRTHTCQTLTAAGRSQVEKTVALMVPISVQPRGFSLISILTYSTASCPRQSPCSSIGNCLWVLWFTCQLFTSHRDCLLRTSSAQPPAWGSAFPSLGSLGTGPFAESGNLHNEGLKTHLNINKRKHQYLFESQFHRPCVSCTLASTGEGQGSPDPFHSCQQHRSLRSLEGMPWALALDRSQLWPAWPWATIWHP